MPSWMQADQYARKLGLQRYFLEHVDLVKFRMVCRRFSALSSDDHAILDVDRRVKPIKIGIRGK